LHTSYAILARILFMNLKSASNVRPYLARTVFQKMKAQDNKHAMLVMRRGNSFSRI